MKQFFTIICAIAVLNLNVNAQDITKHEIDGDKYLFRYDYHEAIDSYVHAKYLTPSGLRNLAKSYAKLNNYRKAEETFALLVNSMYELFPEDYFQYAMVLKMNGKFIESNSWLTKFQLLKPNDLRAQSFAKNVFKVDNLKKDSGRFSILPMEMNTNAEDFGTAYYGDKIVFASTRSEGSILNRKDNRTNQPYLDLYVSNVTNNQLSTPELFSNSINERYNVGPASFNKEGSFMAFTRNKHKDHGADHIVELQIYFSTFNGGNWSTPEPFVYNNPAYSVGQPYLTLDGKTMYFTSDMPGGYGSSDIYKTTKNEQNVWSNPQNLGDKINTEGDEMFPFYQESKEVFLFASTGHYGYGGLDVFMCRLSGSKIGAVSNLGYPLNSIQDDYALILNDSLTKGYLSSNRIEGNFDHIFGLNVLQKLEVEKKIIGVSKDYSGKYIPNAHIVLQNENGQQRDTLTSNQLGEYAFLVPSNQQFHLVGTKLNYGDGHRNVNSIGNESDIYADLVMLNKLEIDSAKLKVGNDLAKIIHQNSAFKGNLKKDIAYFDFDKSNIRPDAALELDKIIAIMNAYPTMVIKLGSHTDCSASKEYNQTLSEKRAQSSLEYIKQKITSPARIMGAGYGETKLINGCDCKSTVYSGCTDAQNQLNRRTEFIILQNK